ncbi:MAG TPA: choice-of-anchor tandem repeat GloVer-containing protein [Terriglobales bacterium]|jgi:uncharacterized repeat protein (TIGR03803 family)
MGDLIFDQAGNIYGTTVGGGVYGFGAVFKMTPSTGGWTESVLYSFTVYGPDGSLPYSGVIFDRSGNLYGTTIWGGSCRYGVGCGTVFQLTPSGSGWTEHVL